MQYAGMSLVMPTLGRTSGPGVDSVAASVRTSTAS